LPTESLFSLEALFSEAITESTLNTDTFLLTTPGPDDLPGTEDDVIVANSQVSFDSETNVARLTFEDPLPAASYRVLLQSDITDSFQNLLGETFSWDFEVREPVQWSEDSDGFWDVGSNWNNGDSPITDDLVSIDRTNGEYTVTHRSGSSDIVKLITSENLLLSGGTLTLQQASSIGGSFNMTGGSRSGPGELVVQGPFTWTGGTFDGGGTTRFASGMGLSDSTKFSIGNHTVINEGATTIIADFGFSSTSGVFINESSGTVSIEIPVDRNITGAGSPEPIFQNKGTVNKLLNTIISINDVDVQNDGLFDIKMGTLNLNGTSTSSGDFQVLVGSVLGFQNGPHRLNQEASITGAGTVRFAGDVALFGADYNVSGTTMVSGGGVIRIEGPVLNVGETLSVTGGQIAFNHAQTVISGDVEVAGSFGTKLEFNQPGTIVTPNSLTLSDSGTLGGSGIIAPVQTINWSGGTMIGTGITRAGAGININNASTLAIRESRTLENDGAAEWTGTGEIQFEPDAVIRNLDGATFNIQNDKRMYSFTGVGGLFENHGMVVKSIGTGTSDFDIEFNSPGDVDVQTGRLDFGRITEFGGMFKLASGTVSELSGNPTTFTADSTVNSEGEIIFRSFATVDGSYSSAITEIRMGSTVVVDFNGDASSDVTEFKAGNLGGTGTYTVVTSMDWLSGGMRGTGTTRNDGTLTISGTGSKFLEDGRVLENAGTIVWSGSFLIPSDGSIIHNLPEGTIDQQVDAGISDGGGSTDPMLLNEGEFKKSAGTGNSSFAIPIVNSGTMEAMSGKLRFTADYHQSAGVTRLSGGSIFAPSNKLFEIAGGSVTGSGDIEAVISNGGTFAPGSSAGKLTVTGTYSQTTDGSLQIEIGGNIVETEYDQLQISGVASLAGSLNITLINSFDPNINDTFEILTYGSHDGEFETIQGLAIGAGKAFVASYTPTGLILTVVPVP
jgi:hypothetical protein